MEPRPSQPRSGSGAGGPGQGAAGRPAGAGGASSAGRDLGRPERPSGAGASPRPAAPPGTGGAGWIPPAVPPPASPAGSAGATPRSPFATPSPDARTYPYSTSYPTPPPNPYAAPPAVPSSEYGPIRDIYDPNFAAAYYGGGAMAPEAAAQDVPVGRLTGLESRTSRRRRAILSGIATALAVVLVVGLIAFALWQTQQGDDGDGREAARAGAGTPPALAAAAGDQPPPGEAGEPAETGVSAGDVAAEAPDGTAAATEDGGDASLAGGEAAGGAPADEGDEAAAGEASDEEASEADDAGAAEASGAEPTPTPNSGGRSLANLVPAEDEVPDGFVLTDEGKLDEEAVAATFADPEEARQRLEEWGWRGNQYRQFEWSPDRPAPAGATNFLVVSVHRFDSSASANAALGYFSDVVITAQGLQPVQIEPLGDEALALVGNPDEATLVVLYVRTGPYLIRIGGASPDGDPTEDVVALARTILVNEPGAVAEPAGGA